MPQYQNFSNPTITPDQQTGWQSASQNLSGLTQAISAHMLDTKKTQDAIKTLMLKNQLEQSAAITKAKAVKDAEFQLEQKRLEQHIRNVQAYPDYYRAQGEIVPDHWSDQNPNHSSYDVPENAQSQNPLVTQPLMSTDSLPGMSLKGGGVGDIQGRSLSLNPISQARSAVGQGIAPQSVNPVQQAQPVEQPQYNNVFNPITGGYKQITNKAYQTPQQKLQLQDKEDQFNQRQYTTILNKVNPATASSRSTIGMAANGNLRANRAIATIQTNPILTYQDLGNVIADLAGIYQGGSPSDMGMRHQQYETIQGKLANLTQFVTGKPQNAVPQAIKDKVMNTLNGLKDVNDQAIKQAFDATEQGQKKVLDNFKDEWSSFRKQVENDYMSNDKQKIPSYDAKTQKLQRNKTTGEYRVVNL